MFESKLRRGDVISVTTQDGYELLIEAVDIGHRRVLLTFSGPHHFKMTRVSAGIESDGSYAAELGREASHEAYIRKMIDSVEDLKGASDDPS